MFRAIALLLVSSLSFASPDYQPLLDQSLDCPDLACFKKVKSNIDQMAINDGKQKRLSPAWEIAKSSLKPSKDGNGVCGADNGFYCAANEYIYQINK